MPMVVNNEQLANSQRIKNLYSLYQQNRDLINIGAYQAGSNPAIDEAIAMYPQISSFMQQGINENMNFAMSQQQLQQLAAAQQNA